jgi:hypothetical protein
MKATMLPDSTACARMCSAWKGLLPKLIDTEGFRNVLPDKVFKMLVELLTSGASHLQVRALCDEEHNFFGFSRICVMCIGVWFLFPLSAGVPR